MKNRKIPIVLGIIVLVIDQITKTMITNKNISIISGLLNFTYTKNTGGAFSIGADNLILIIIINILTLGIVTKFLKERRREMNLKMLTFIILILSGGIGNLIDRVFRGYVIDFIDVNLFNFPTFNIADISIVVGVFGIVVLILKSLTDNKRLEEGKFEK